MFGSTRVNLFADWLAKRDVIGKFDAGRAGKYLFVPVFHLFADWMTKRDVIGKIRCWLAETLSPAHNLLTAKRLPKRRVS